MSVQTYPQQGRQMVKMLPQVFHRLLVLRVLHDVPMHE